MPFPTTYLTVTEADALAASILGLMQWSAASATDKANALAAATRLIDGGVRYQGRRYDSAQTLQFPRVAFDSGAAGANTAGANGAAELIWDWDPATSAAVIPPAVKHACLIEADEILQDVAGKSPRWRRLDEQHQGVTFDLTGAAAEAYRKGIPAAGRTGLCRRAYELLAPYRMVSGRIV
jgi:DnaT-like ssDNA binding protein